MVRILLQDYLDQATMPSSTGKKAEEYSRIKFDNGQSFDIGKYQDVTTSFDLQVYSEEMSKYLKNFIQCAC
jgi:hypothetical protein